MSIGGNAQANDLRGLSGYLTRQPYRRSTKVSTGEQARVKLIVQRVYRMLPMLGALTVSFDELAGLC